MLKSKKITKIFSKVILCTLVLMLALVTTVSASEQQNPQNGEWVAPPGWGEATPISSAVIVDGTEIEFYAYEIYGNNFFRLRDLAYALNGSQKQFEVSFDSNLAAVAITSGQPYTVIGGEMQIGNSVASITPTASPMRFMLDGEEISLMAYLINGNNFVRLRDIGWVLNFSVQFDGRVLIDTNYGYGARLFIDNPDSDIQFGGVGRTETICRAWVEERVRFLTEQGIVVSQMYIDLLRELPLECANCLRMSQNGENLGGTEITIGGDSGDIPVINISP